MDCGFRAVPQPDLQVQARWMVGRLWLCVAQFERQLCTSAVPTICFHRCLLPVARSLSCGTLSACCKSLDASARCIFLHCTSTGLAMFARVVRCGQHRHSKPGPGTYLQCAALAFHPRNSHANASQAAHASHSVRPIGQAV